MKERIKHLLMLLSLVLLTQVAVAQITGTVKGEDGEPLAGVSVVVKGSTAGVITQFDGKYSINASEGDVLVFSMIGMATQEAQVSGSTVDVTMGTDVQTMDEVMVVAYGTTKKSSFTGSASTIKGTDLEKQQSSNLSKSLEGKVAGVETTSGSGQPGASAAIIVRGLGSISASRSPLIVVDGVPYEGSLNSIPSFDVESMTILKDAAANSIYGARGSNGVVIITTKKGKSGKIRVNFDARMGVNSRGIPAYDVITDAGEYYEMYWESLRNKNLQTMSYMEANAAASASLIDGGLVYNVYKNVPNNQLVNPATGKLNPLATEKKWNDNWMEDPFRNGLRQEYNVSVSSGTDNNNLYASLSYLGDEGYIAGSDFGRVSARVKTEQKVGKYVKVGGSVNYARTNMNNVAASNAQYNNLFMFGQQIAPIYPIYLYNLSTGEPILDANGGKQYDFGETYARPYAAQQNPMATIRAGENTILVDVLSSRGFFEVNFLKDFKFTTNIAYDMFTTNQVEYMTPIGGDAYTVGGRGERQVTRYAALNVNQLLNYKKTFADLHNVDVLLGHESKMDDQRYLYGHMTNFIDPNSSEFSNAAMYQDLTSGAMEYALEGYFGRLDYNFDEKYYLTASLRRDASSRFHPDVRWGTFWALGGSWLISKESFLSDVEFINSFKLKASYGTQGNDNILNPDGSALWYAYRNLYSVDRVGDDGAVSWSLRGNPNLTWEKSNNFNVGLELAAWSDRIFFNIDYFIKETKDLLYQKPMATSEGLPGFQWVNDIDMKNTGVEFELGVDVIKTNDFRWNVNLNATHYKNELTRLPADKQALIEKDGGYQAGSYWRKIGGSIYDFYTYEYAGVNPENGLAQYKKYTKDNDNVETMELVDGTSEATYRQTNKSAIPDVYGGLGTTVDFMGFDFSLQAAYQIGGYVMDDIYAAFMNPGESGTNFHKDMFKRWTPENPNTNVPKLLFEDLEQAALSDRWLTKASYFSIRNITLGYSFPKKWMETIKLEKLRVYATVDNLWYSSKRQGLDVRQSFSGIVDYAYSPLRTISFGVSANF